MKLTLENIAVNGRHRRDLGDVDALAASIDQIGLLHPVVVTSDHRLIAGERRIAAAKKLGWKDIDVRVAESIGDALTMLTAERDENTCRKDFAPSEAVAVGEALEELERPKAKERQAEGQKRGGETAGRGREKVGGNLPPSKTEPKTRDRVAAAVGMSGRTYDKAKAVVAAAQSNPEKFTPIKDAMDRTGKVDKAFRKVNAARIADAPAMPLPTGTYDVILADPPWKYDASETETRHLDNQYPTLDDDEIYRLRPPSADDAVLFLWATAPKLVEALEAMKAWGFNYRTSAVWDKEKIGMGYWFRGQHELLLVGVKGKFSPPTPEKRVSSVIRSPRSRHSTKPEIVHEMLEDMFPKSTRLELFARHAREGWTVWGNQA